MQLMQTQIAQSVRSAPLFGAVFGPRRQMPPHDWVVSPLAFSHRDE
jgi:hypothetical protein